LPDLHGHRVPRPARAFNPGAWNRGVNLPPRAARIVPTTGRQIAKPPLFAAGQAVLQVPSRNTAWLSKVKRHSCDHAANSFCHQSGAKMAALSGFIGDIAAE